MEPRNGKATWTRWGIGVLITFLMFLGGNVIANDKASRERDNNLKDCLHLIQTEIVQRLVRIETKIDK